MRENLKEKVSARAEPGFEARASEQAAPCRLTVCGAAGASFSMAPHIGGGW